jgi:hypothetical protein
MNLESRSTVPFFPTPPTPPWPPLKNSRSPKPCLCVLAPWREPGLCLTPYVPQHRRSQLEVAGILADIPEPHVGHNGTKLALDGKRFRLIRPKCTDHQHNLLISHYYFLFFIRHSVTYANYCISNFDRLLTFKKKRQKYAKNKKGTGFPTGENPCPFSALGQESAAPPLPYCIKNELDLRL